MSPSHVVVPLSDTILFPGQTLVLRLAPSRTTQGLDEAYVAGKQVLLLATRQLQTSYHPDNLYTLGVLAVISSLVQHNDGTYQAQFTAISRAEVTGMLPLAYPCAQVQVCEVHPVELAVELLPELQELTRRHSFSGSRRALPSLALQLVLQTESAADAADLIAHYCDWSLNDKQKVLETLDPVQRVSLTITLLQRDIEQHALDQRIAERVRQQQVQQQRDQYLREQLRAIDRELYGEDQNEVEMLRNRLDEAKLPEHVKVKTERELARLERTLNTSPEHDILRTHLEWLAELPWQVAPSQALDLVRATQVLDSEHYGLESVKERILDYLAVICLANERQLNMQSAITGTSLCLVGPPGVGKTSIAQSIARAMNRKFIRLALGGIKDEAEIRGHRRTYVGAMPGRLLQAIRSTGVANPVILLDEIDKLAGDSRNGISSALLEVLDPQQNRTFTDHYLEVEYDLSQVVFIATANTLSSLSRPLLDRLEIVQLSGYTPAEKFAIAKRHLLPRLLARHGLTDQTLFHDAALIRIGREYTQEAGVRQLEQQLTQILRKTARAYIHVPWNGQRIITSDDIPSYLGPARFSPDSLVDDGKPGLAHSLAWSTVGGSLLEVEAAFAPGQGSLSLTGSVGKILTEAAHAAVAHIRTLGSLYGVPDGYLDSHHLYLHFPDTATPKDGASIGLAVVASILSALQQQSLPRHLAMTGEVTLLGRILPVAGIREKLLAAEQAGIQQVLLPEGNQADVANLPHAQIQSLNVIYVNDIREVIPYLLISLNDEVKQLPQSYTLTKTSLRYKSGQE